ncbi:hypothetical protein HDE_04878 [Halotydeus destructor]|nr:hypothetical protein HDE_04878 [Halotydeus destructor]
MNSHSVQRVLPTDHRVTNHRTLILTFKYILVFVLFLQLCLNSLQSYLVFENVILYRNQDYDQSYGQLGKPSDQSDDILIVDKYLQYFLYLYSLILVTWTMASFFAILSVCVEIACPILFLAIMQSLIVFIKVIFYLWPESNLRIELIVIKGLIAVALFYYVHLIKDEQSRDYLAHQHCVAL